MLSQTATAGPCACIQFCLQHQGCRHTAKRAGKRSGCVKSGEVSIETETVLSEFPFAIGSVADQIFRSDRHLKLRRRNEFLLDGDYFCSLLVVWALGN